MTTPGLFGEEPASTALADRVAFLLDQEPGLRESDLALALEYYLRFEGLEDALGQAATEALRGWLHGRRHASITSIDRRRREQQNEDGDFAPPFAVVRRRALASTGVMRPRRRMK